MPKQERISPQARERQPEEYAEEAPAARREPEVDKEQTDALLDQIDLVLIENEDVQDIDKLLDEIDEVLERNAEEFVASYQQRGGQ